MPITRRRTAHPRGWTAVGAVAFVAASLLVAPAPASTASKHVPAIVFMREGFSDDTRILVSNSSGSWTEPLTLSHRFARALPRWRPDGRRILYTQANVNGWADTDLMIMGPHGHHKKMLLAGQKRYFIDDLAWAPDGSRVALAMSDLNDNGPTDVWVYTLATGELQQLHVASQPDRVVQTVDWSPDGTIAFSAYDFNDPNEDTDLYFVQPDVSGLLQVTDTPLRRESSPRFSPDGQHLVYLSIHDRCRSLVVANADGTNRQRAGAGCRVGFTGASWSPDSVRLLVELVPDYTPEIWAVSPDGLHKRFITRGEYASWRPTGA